MLHDKVPSESLAPRVLVPTVAALWRCFPPCGACRGALLVLMWWVKVLREKSLALGSQTGDNGRNVATYLQASSWRPSSDIGVCFSCHRIWWMLGQRPRVDDACMLRRRPREPCWAVAPWGVFVAHMAWVTILCHQGGKVVGLVNVPQRRRVDF
jgi:hypothetical protein